jgi:hypothetical protein
MAYPSLTNISAGVLPDLFTYANDVTSGIAGASFLVGVMIITAIGLGFTTGKVKALTGAGWVGLILSFPLYYSQVIIAEILWGVVIFTAIMTFITYFVKEEV